MTRASQAPSARTRASARPAGAASGAGDAKAGRGNGLEALEGHRCAAGFTPSVGTVLYSLESVSDVGRDLLGPCGTGLGQFALEDAVGIGQAPQLRDERQMFGALGRLGRRLGDEQTAQLSEGLP